MQKQEKQYRKSFSLSWADNNTLIIFRDRSFFYLNVDTNQKLFIAKIENLKIIKIFFLKFNLTRRIFRLFPYSFTKISDYEYLFSFDGYIYLLNTQDKTVKQECNLDHHARRTLSILCTKNGDVYYGEYPTSYDKKPVNIYKRYNNGKFEIVYAFKNEIRHIHLLIEKDKDIYCFTGDEDNEIKILKFMDGDFSTPAEILSGSQEYRTCAAYIDKDRLIYCTDTPYYQNNLKIVRLDNNQLIKSIPLPSSVIYSGQEDENGFYFSTSCEANLKKEGKDNVKIKIDGINGGILTKYIYLYYFDYKTESIKEIIKLKKDPLPFKLGLGTFMIPKNSSSKYVAFTACATKKDGTLFIYKKQVI